MRNKNIHRILGTMPTVAAYSYRHRIGRCVLPRVVRVFVAVESPLCFFRPYVDPADASSGLTYCENFL